MNKHNKFSIAFKTFVIIPVLIDLIYKSNSNLNILLIYSILIIFLYSNEIIRDIFLSVDSLFNNLSILLSTLLCGLFIYTYNFSGINIIFYYLIFIIFKQTNKTNIILMISIHFITFLLCSNLLQGALLSSITSYGFLTNLISYIGFIVIFYLIKARSEEAEKNKKLNKDYTSKVEDLALAEERNRIAQELHDSLGHYLMALSMNLDFADKIALSNPTETKEIILKSKHLVKSSISALRETVYTIKENEDFLHLENKLTRLKENFLVENLLDINITYDKTVDSSKSKIKEVIFKTVQEALTNGVKHGKATKFIINIYLTDNIINIKISNNGKSTEYIKKSNGLNGMEERIVALNGCINFLSKEGFIILAKIPMESGEYDD